MCLPALYPTTHPGLYLSKHLRHQPERLGLRLEPGGWVVVDDLLAACARHGMATDRAELTELVRRDGKQRYSFDEDERRIRANQGHTVEVDLQLEPLPPPERLYQGTAERSVEAIAASGLLRMARHHVHLSADVETARQMGVWHGRSVVLEIAAARMGRDSYPFYRSDNGVWLVDRVPPEYIAMPTARDS